MAPPQKNRHARNLMFALLGLFFALQCVQVRARIPNDQSIFKLDYEFGPFCSSILRHGRFADCSYTPCRRSNRMPVLPLLLAGLGKLSTRARPVAFMKNALMLLGTGALLAWLLAVQCRVFPGSAWTWICLAPLAVMEPIVRYSAAIKYEEGLLTEWLTVWSLAFLLSSCCLLRGHPREGSRLAGATLALATLMALTKSTLLVVWLLSLGLAAAWIVSTRSLRLCTVAATCVLALAAWGVRNAGFGRFTLATSWEGENLYRGFNSQSYVIYPYIPLGQTVFPPHYQILEADISAKLGHQGPELLGLGHRSPAFKNEWAWDDYWRSQALHWMRSHPGPCLKFEARKAAHFFLCLHPEPFEDGNLGPAERTWGRVSLLLERLAELGLVLLLALLWTRGGFEGRGLAVFTVAVNAAYALPYVLVFNYERHFAIYSTVVAASCTVVLAALRPGSKVAVGADAAPERPPYRSRTRTIIGPEAASTASARMRGRCAQRFGPAFWA